jgi:hypothetical protein
MLGQGWRLAEGRLGPSRVQRLESLPLHQMELVARLLVVVGRAAPRECFWRGLAVMRGWLLERLLQDQIARLAEQGGLGRRREADSCAAESFE